MAVGVMWFMTALVFFFLCLRLYTRLVCLASYGIDDHIYAVAFVSSSSPFLPPTRSSRVLNSCLCFIGFPAHFQRLHPPRC